MTKKVVNLVKIIGARSYEEVTDWLRQVGFDVDAPGFSPLTEVDDETIAKLKSLVSSVKGAEKKSSVKRIRRVVDEAPSSKPTKTLKDIISQTKADVKAVVEKEARRETTATAHAKLKPILQEKKPLKVKLEKAKKKKEDTEEELAIVPEKAIEQEVEEPSPEEQLGLDIEFLEEEELRQRREKRLSAAELVRAKPRPRERRPSRTIKEILSEDEGVVTSRKRFFKVKGLRRREPVPEVRREIKISRPMSIREVSAVTGVKVSDVIQFLFEELDVVANINYVASIDEIELICDKFNIACERVPQEEPEQELEVFEETKELHPIPRPPVVTVMGHVDHGKTKLLDYIRKTNVVDEESGGITQHIGAYQTIVNDKKITFIDTPGHEAFTAIRARGSQVTDIVVLVVAADDGVMPQTLEAIDHAKAAGVPTIVALNKIDKPDANPEKVKHELAKVGLTPEEWGGDTIMVCISALTGEGVQELLEMIQLQAEIMELKADPNGPPYGVVIESQIDPGLGIVATVLVQQGTFEKGMYILSGESVGRIRIMLDEKLKEVTNATPSTPVRIVGFSELPQNGDKVYGFKDKRKCEQIAEARALHRKLEELKVSAPKVSLDDVFNRIREGELKELQLVVKADFQGSVEAVKESIQRISVEGTRVRVIRAGVGQISESDVMLASASNAVIIGFRVGTTVQAKHLAEQERVQIKEYDIIYKLLEDIELALKGLLEPEIVEVPIGTLEVRAVFRQDKNVTIAGGMVLTGKVQRGAQYRIRRNGTIIHQGQINSLKRFKEDVREVAEGFECGVLIEGSEEVREGDLVEVYVTEKHSRHESEKPSEESARSS